MRILAITDGSREAQAIIGLLDDYADIHVQNIQSLTAIDIRTRPFILLALSRWSERLLQQLPTLLSTFGASHRNSLLCMSADDRAKLVKHLKSTPINLVSLSATKQEFLDAIKKADPTVKLTEKRDLLLINTTQSLSNTFGSVLGNEGQITSEWVEIVGDASGDVSEAIDEHGIKGWMTCVATHHSYTARHCMSVAGFASQWANILGFHESDRDQFTKAALLHDIGKTAVPLSILDKPGRLTDEERHQIERHPEEGHQILLQNTYASDLAKSIALSHHELLDGSGYPHGLSGRDISDFVRCSTIIDIYSALVDRRSYKDPMSPTEALAVLTSMKGKLDPHLLDAFRPIVEMHGATLKKAA